MTNKVALVGNHNFHLACDLGGYEVVRAADISSALALKPDVIFLDHEGVRTLQPTMGNINIPVIFMFPSNHDKEAYRLARSFGCIDFIQQGDKEDLILSILRTYLCLSKITAISGKLIEKTSC